MPSRCSDVAVQNTKTIDLHIHVSFLRFQFLSHLGIFYARCRYNQWTQKSLIFIERKGFLTYLLPKSFSNFFNITTNLDSIRSESEFRRTPKDPTNIRIFEKNSNIRIVSENRIRPNQLIILGSRCAHLYSVHDIICRDRKKKKKSAILK